MMAQCDVDVDARMRRLVDAIDRLPGLSTFASSGGHADPALAGAAGNCFYVEVRAQASLEGMQSLGRLAWVAMELAAGMYDAQAVTLTAWTGELGDPPFFSLEGRRGADPDALAELVERALPRPFQRRLRLI